MCCGHFVSCSADDVLGVVGETLRWFPYPWEGGTDRRSPPRARSPLLAALSTAPENSSNGDVDEDDTMNRHNGDIIAFGDSSGSLSHKRQHDRGSRCIIKPRGYGRMTEEDLNESNGVLDEGSVDQPDATPESGVEDVQGSTTTTAAGVAMPPAANGDPRSTGGVDEEETTGGDVAEASSKSCPSTDGGEDGISQRAAGSVETTEENGVSKTETQVGSLSSTFARLVSLLIDFRRQSRPAFVHSFGR